ncbi:MAG: Rieske 2Fe-2S domain-containing protein [Actinomycetota bacterium]|nr:Rieske 2Fe-2S domain-containing protein [Actinomycetota bacterium]
MKLSDVQQSEGLTGEIDGREVAAFGRDGQMIVLENVCTHRGCQTIWNPDEKTWDCPCHGSRFSADGQVIQGPARAPLKPLRFEVVDDDLKLVE